MVGFLPAPDRTRSDRLRRTGRILRCVRWQRGRELQAGRPLIDGVKTLPFSITNTGNAGVNLSPASTDGVFQVPSTPVPANGQSVNTTLEARPAPVKIGRDDTSDSYGHRQSVV